MLATVSDFSACNHRSFGRQTAADAALDRQLEATLRGRRRCELPKNARPARASHGDNVGRTSIDEQLRQKCESHRLLRLAIEIDLVERSHVTPVTDLLDYLRSAPGSALPHPKAALRSIGSGRKRR